jgi:hypothetical protein
MASVTVALIRDTVAAYYGMASAELVGADRTMPACQRRAVAYHLCAELTDLGDGAIGAEFGGRDHTSVARGLSRPLSFEHSCALEALRERLVGKDTHSGEIVRRWPFRSRRKPQVPMFIRRYTA